jgi:Integrase zinc binding domain
LELPLRVIGKYLRTFHLDPSIDGKDRKAIKRGAKNYALVEDELFTRTAKGFRAIPAPQERSKVLRTLHDDIGHWDLKTTLEFIKERFWWP